jgi:hypothetical protein
MCPRFSDSSARASSLGIQLGEAALNALTANMRVELHARSPNIHVTLVMPGMVATNLRATHCTRRPTRRSTRPHVQTMEQVADIVASASKIRLRGVHQFVVGGDGKQVLRRCQRVRVARRKPMGLLRRWSMNRRLLPAVFVVALSGNSPWRSGSPPRAVQPERPTVATHAGTVAPGYLEIETGVERDRFDAGGIGYGAPTVFKFGITSRAQLSIGAPVNRPAPGDLGFGDVSIGVKWRLVQDAPIVGDFALLPANKFASGSSRRGTGTGTTDLSLLAISSHKFGNVAIDINAGYTRRSGNGSTAPRNATLWTFSPAGRLPARSAGPRSASAIQAPVVWRDRADRRILVGPTSARSELARSTPV